jgi:transcription antitermination factor NusG
MDMICRQVSKTSVVGDGAERPPFWYALHTHYKHEKAAARILTQNGFDIFLPLYDVAHRWKDRTRRLSLPLFPCYVFIRGGLDRRLQIVSTPGVLGLVGSSGRAAAIPEREIEAVLRMVESSLRLEPHPFLRCGDWVRVKSGPLEGIEGILVRKKNLFRLVLSVEMLERSVVVEVNATAVESVIRHNAAHAHAPRGCGEAGSRSWARDDAN